MLPWQHQPSSTLGPLTSPTTSDLQNVDQICREYLRGNCTKYGQCRHRHELDLNIMKEVLQFCHDYQNRNGCTRKNCKFLHASKEEQNTFLATGQIPRVLAERHAALAAATSNMQSNAETIPQIAMFINESYMSQPPPDTWPPLPPPPAVLPPMATAPPPPPPSSSPPRHAAGPSGPPSAQQLPPPSAPASGVAQLRPVATAYSAMPQQSSSVLFSMCQPAAMVAEKFDPSKPPPPLPSHMHSTNNGQLKRKVDANGNAATCKIRKPDGPEVSDQHCESCVQRKLRIEGYKHQLEAMHNEEENQILLYKKKLQEYERGRDILKKLVGPELFAVFDNLIEGTQPPQLDNPGSFISGSSTMCKEAVIHLFRVLIEGGTRNIDPVPSTSHVDERLQSLTAMTRGHNAGSFPNAGPDLAKYVAGILKNSTAERSTDQEVPGEQMVNRTNGYLSNGQKPQTSTSEPARYGAQTAYAGPSVQVAHQAMPGAYPVAGPSGYASGAPPAAPPAGGYMFHPSIPPPNRHYYPQNPAVSGTGGMPYNGTERAPGPVPGPAPVMQAPAAPAAPRPATNAPNYNYMARYPQPPYFQPYQ